MRLILRLFIAAFLLLLVLNLGWLYLSRRAHDTPHVMLLDQGHMNDNDWRLYWFAPELHYQRPFTDPLYDLQVIGWWHDWLYFYGNTGWFEDTTGNQLRNVYRVQAGDHQPEWVVGSVIKRGIKWLPDQNRLIYPAPIDANRTDLFSLNLADGQSVNLTADLPDGMNVRRLPLDISFDGTWVLFFSADLHTPNQYAARTNGTSLIAVDAVDTFDPTHSEYSLVEINNALFQLDAEGDLAILPTKSEMIEAWLPNQNMLVSSADGQVIASILDGSPTIWKSAGKYLTSSSDSIYIQKSDGSTVKMPLTGGTPEPVANDIVMLWGWTPDGKWLVYQDGVGDLWRIQPDTRQREFLRPLGNSYIYNVGPSPDGEWWVYMESTSTTTTLRRIRMKNTEDQYLLTLEKRTALPTTLFAGWTPPFEKNWHPMWLGFVIMGGALGISGLWRRIFHR